MALFGRDDRDRGFRGGMGNQGYDRAFRSGRNQQGRYDNRMGLYRYEPVMHSDRYGRDMESGRYGRDMGAAGYDRNFKSRWQTNHGDPFGDRAARTPMRMLRGGFRSGYDRGLQGYDRDAFHSGRMNRYDADPHAANPTGYDPYSSRQDTWMRDDIRANRGYGRDYGSRWFF